jgi:GAF domain-containing protein
MSLAVAECGRILELEIERATPQIISDRSDKERAGLSRLGISAVVPLWLDGPSIGAILTFQLLPQRSAFDSEDRAVLRLLSAYAGRCLRSRSCG